MEALTSAKVKAEEVAVKRAEQINALELAKSASDQAAAANQAQIELMAKEKADVAKQLQSKGKTHDELSQKLKTAEAEKREAIKSRQLTNEELAKAVAQIELLKVLLIHEQEL